MPSRREARSSAISSMFSITSTHRLPAACACERMRLVSSSMVVEKRTITPRFWSTAASSRVASSHCATMRISSSTASTRAAPDRKIAWLSASMSRFMVFISCGISSPVRSHLIGGYSGALWKCLQFVQLLCADNIECKCFEAAAVVFGRYRLNLITFSVLAHLSTVAMHCHYAGGREPDVSEALPASRYSNY